MEKEKLIVSACLLGCAVRYDGNDNGINGLKELMERYEVIPVCPEQLGGLTTPRTPAERVGEEVLTQDGRNVTENFRRGAEEALRLAKLFGAKKALLKEKSPSCGAGIIYDGSFSHTLTEGNGLTAQLFLNNGIEVTGEKSIEKLMH